MWDVNAAPVTSSDVLYREPRPSVSFVFTSICNSSGYCQIEEIRTSRFVASFIIRLVLIISGKETPPIRWGEERKLKI